MWQQRDSLHIPRYAWIYFCSFYPFAFQVYFKSYLMIYDKVKQHFLLLKLQILLNLTQICHQGKGYAILPKRVFGIGIFCSQK